MALRLIHDYFINYTQYVFSAHLSLVSYYSCHSFQISVFVYKGRGHNVTRVSK